MSDINDKPLQKALEILEAAALTHDDFTASDTCAAAFATVKARIEADAASQKAGETMSGYGHDEAMADIFDLAHIETEFEGHDPRVTGLAAYIERLEAERDALLAEHEVYPFLNRTAWQAAHDNAERVMRGE